MRVRECIGGWPPQTIAGNREFHISAAIYQQKAA